MIPLAAGAVAARKERGLQREGAHFERAARKTCLVGDPPIWRDSMDFSGIERIGAEPVQSAFRRRAVAPRLEIEFRIIPAVGAHPEYGLPEATRNQRRRRRTRSKVGIRVRI